MASLNMQGPYPLDLSTVNSQVTKTSPGNYALGYSKDKTFYVQYVGRADVNVNARINQHVGKGYQLFMFSYATSPKAAFEKECHNYHDFGGPDGMLKNKYHPDRPVNSGWKCPVCTIFD
jgi:hypothetical protein